MEQSTRQLTVNGKASNAAARTLRELIVELGLDSRPVAAMVNGEVIPRARHAEHELRAGDQVELISMAGGG